MLPEKTVLQGRYEIIKQIGKGGMGAVYQAIDTKFGSIVAVKQTLYTEEYLLRAFRSEAKLLHELRHDALPRVTDHFEESGQFLVMDFIAGNDLDEVRAQRAQVSPLTLAEILQWGDLLIDALIYLHTMQREPIIHRDIKPKNLKLTPGGKLYLLDFGLAKGLPADATRVTTGRSIFGHTAHFASLEQIQGEETKGYSDIYSLAATLYNLLTGEKPVDAQDRLYFEKRTGADPLKRADVLDPQIPGAVADLLSEAMALLPEQRLATAKAMRKRLRDVALQCGVTLNDPLLQPPIPPPIQPIQPPIIEEEIAETVLADQAPAQSAIPAPAIAEAPKPKIWSLLAEISVACQNAWPLDGDRVLVWQAQTKILSVRGPETVIWNKELKTPLRCVARGPQGQWAVGTWDGEVICFAEGALPLSQSLGGTIGEAQFSNGRWLAGTWNGNLVSISLKAGLGLPIESLSNVEMGVLRIAVKANSDRFAVADTRGGIRLYSGATSIGQWPLDGVVTSLAFVGNRLLALMGKEIATINLVSNVVALGTHPGDARSRLLALPEASQCLLLSGDGKCYSVNESVAFTLLRDFAGARLLSVGDASQRFTVVRPSHGCAYLRDGQPERVWETATAANLSTDGRLITVVFADKVELYEDTR